MTSFKSVVYLHPPISVEVKREWNAKGYKVNEIANMPEGYDNPAKDSEPEKPKGKAKKEPA